MAIVLIPTLTGKGVNIGGVFLDVTDSEEYEKQYTVTDNPIEDGSNVTDHIQEQPDQVTIGGIISATPISDEDIYIGRTTDLLAQLETIAASGVPFDVFGRVKTYKSMLITGISASSSNDTGLSLRMSITLKRVRIARFREVDLPPQILATGSGNQGATDSDQIPRYLNVAELNQLLELELREKAARAQLEAAITAEDTDEQLGARAELSGQPETAALLDEILGGK